MVGTLMETFTRHSKKDKKAGSSNSIGASMKEILERIQRVEDEIVDSLIPNTSFSNPEIQDLAENVMNVGKIRCKKTNNDSK